MKVYILYLTLPDRGMSVEWNFGVFSSKKSAERRYKEKKIPLGVVSHRIEEHEVQQ